jgi:hypothetical protein
MTHWYSRQVDGFNPDKRLEEPSLLSGDPRAEPVLRELSKYSGKLGYLAFYGLTKLPEQE